MKPRTTVTALIALAALALPACAVTPMHHTARDTASGTAAASIAKIHGSRCGACHVPVEPGTRSRAKLETALARHHNRVHLTGDQWTAMVDYLSPPP